MNKKHIAHNVKHRLPSVRGSVTVVDMHKLTWFRTGGQTCVFTPADSADLQQFLQNLDRDIALYPLGLGSNTLVRDGGYKGVVIRTTRLNNITVQGTTITAGAGVADAKLAKTAQQYGLSGLEFMMGIPGAVGGAIAMNAGAYGAEIKDVLVSASALNRQGQEVQFRQSDMGFSYRYCAVAEGLIFTKAVFKTRPDSHKNIQNRMDKIMINRRDSQPVKSATGGSTFRNPNEKKAWELIDSVGLRGYTVGRACISPKHCNFLINTGGAKTADLEQLILMAKNKVQDQHNINLELEIKIIGDTV